MQIKRAEILLILLSTIITLVLGLSLIRWLQPSLLGISNDMVLVSSNEKVTPYYENIFRKEDFLSEEINLKDPYVKIRGKQFLPDMHAMGPNDILGFRNEAVPSYADIIIIGDSQTYGNNAHMQENWPHYFAEYIQKGFSVYSMASGGWGAVQYFYAVSKATIFTPKIIVIAFYTGNDALETFSMAYGSDIWQEFISSKNLNKDDAPKITFPAPESEKWRVTFSDGVTTIFTPTLRNISNMKHPAVDAGYQSMIKIAKQIASIAKNEDIKIVFTIIPTKEYVYSGKIELDKINTIPAYKELINNEKTRIYKFTDALKNIQGAKYVDVITDLKAAALGSSPLYRDDANGHPIAEGYKIIGATIARELNKILTTSNVSNGLAIALTEIYTPIPVYIEDGKYWFVDVPGGNKLINVPDDLVSYAKDGNIQTIKKRDLEGLVYSGHIAIKKINNTY